jgi:hypothetical protein
LSNCGRRCDIFRGRASDVDTLGQIREMLLTGVIPPKPCPRCGRALQVCGGFSCVGRTQVGTKCSGGVDYAYCEHCGRWFEQVFSPAVAPPVVWRERECPPPVLYLPGATKENTG